MHFDTIRRVFAYPPLPPQPPSPSPSPPTSSPPPSPRPPPSPPPQPAAVTFTTVFQADFTTLYVLQQAQFRAAYAAALLAAAPGATLTIDSVAAGSVRVGTTLTFPPNATTTPSGYSCLPVRFYSSVSAS